MSGTDFSLSVVVRKTGRLKSAPLMFGQNERGTNAALQRLNSWLIFSRRNCGPTIEFYPSRSIRSPFHSETCATARVQAVIGVHHNLVFRLGRRRAGSSRGVRHAAQATVVGRDRNRRRRRRRRRAFEEALAVRRVGSGAARQSK